MAGTGFSRTDPDNGASDVQTEQDGGGLSPTLWESGGSPFKTAAFNHSATTPSLKRLIVQVLAQAGSSRF